MVDKHESNNSNIVLDEDKEKLKKSFLEFSQSSTYSPFQYKDINILKFQIISKNRAYLRCGELSSCTGGAIFEYVDGKWEFVDIIPHKTKHPYLYKNSLKVKHGLFPGRFGRMYYWNIKTYKENRLDDPNKILELLSELCRSYYTKTELAMSYYSRDAGSLKVLEQENFHLFYEMYDEKMISHMGTKICSIGSKKYLYIDTLWTLHPHLDDTERHPPFLRGKDYMRLVIDNMKKFDVCSIFLLDITTRKQKNISYYSQFGFKKYRETRHFKDNVKQVFDQVVTVPYEILKDRAERFMVYEAPESDSNISNSENYPTVFRIPTGK